MEDSEQLNNNNQPCVVFTKTTINSALNDDCLAEVLSHMEVADLIHLSRFCDHCLDLIKMRVFTKRRIDFTEIKNKRDIPKLLACFGATASNLKIHRCDIQHRANPTKTDSEELLELLTTNCDVDVLKCLDITLNFNDIVSNQLTAFSTKLKKLDELTVTASCYCSRHRKLDSQENNQHIETLLQNSISIKKFHLKSFSITASFLHSAPLEQLTKLAFVQCDGIQSDALVENSIHLENLEHFEWVNSKFDGISDISDNMETLCDILGGNFQQLTQITVHMNYHTSYCHRNNGSVLNGLCKLSNLENLSIGIAGACACNDFYGCLQKLGHLKKLAIESPVIFAGHQCLPCGKILNNHLPRIFSYLPHLIGLRIVHINKDNEDLLDQIGAELKQIQELHLIGYRKMNGDKLIGTLRKWRTLEVLNIQQTKFHFSGALYSELVEECIQSGRLLKIIVGAEVKRTLFTRIGNAYRKEFVQILN